MALTLVCILALSSESSEQESGREEKNAARWQSISLLERRSILQGSPTSGPG